MDEFRRHRDDSLHRWLPGSRQGAFNCQPVRVRRDAGDEGYFVGSGTEGIEPERIIPRGAIDKETAIRRGQAQGTDSVAHVVVREGRPHEYQSHRMGAEVRDAVMQGVGEREIE